MTQRTPGPWTLRAGQCINDNTMLEVFGPRADHIVTLHKHGTTAEQDRAHADARLIAAAPEMLELIQWFLTYPSPVDGIAQFGYEARALLAKIEGR